MAERTVKITILGDEKRGVAALKATESAAGGLESKLSGLGGVVSKTGGMIATALGAVAIVGGGAVAALGVSSVKAATDFEAAMSGVAAVAGGTDADLKALSETALKLGQDTTLSGIGATDAAQAMQELAAAGMSVADIVGGGALGALRLASAGGIDVARAAEIAGMALSQFGLAGTEAAMVADLFAAAANSSAISVEDIAESMKYVGPVANSMGLSIEETTAAIAALGNQGIKGSAAGTALRSMIVSLASPSKEASGVIKDLGLNMFDTNGKMKSIADVSEELKTKMAGLSDKQRAAALATLFGNEALSAATILYGEGGDGITSWIDKLENGATAAEVGAKRNDNLKGSIASLQGAFETAQIVLGKAFLPALKDLADRAAVAVAAAIPLIEAWGPTLAAGMTAGVAAVAGFASSVMAALPAIIGTFKQLKALITEGDFIGGGIFAEDSPLVTGILAIREGFERLRGLLAQIPAPVLAAVAGFVGLGPALTVVAAVLPTLIGAFTGLGPVISILTSTLPLLGTIIAAIGWPITAVVVAVGLLAAAWTTNFMGIRDLTMPILTAIGAFIAGTFLPALTSIGTTLLTAVMPYVQQFIGFLTGQLLPGIQGIVAVAIPAFQQFAAALMGAFQAALPGIQAFIGGMVALGAAVLPIIAQVAGMIIGSLGPAVMAIVEWAQVVIPQLGAAWENVLGIIGPVVGAIAAFIGDTLTTIAGFITTHSDTIVSVLQGAWDVISGVIGVAWALISGIISTGLQVLSGDWEGAWNTIKATAQTVWDGIQQIISGAWTAITGVVTLALAGVTTALATAWASISSAATTGWESVKSAISTAWENIKTAVTNGISSVVTLMEGLPGKAVAAIGDLSGLLVGAGKALVQGLIDGMNSLLEAVKNKASELANAAANAVKGALGIKSPSTVMIEYGENIGQGLVLGMAGQESGVIGMANRLARGIEAAFTGGVPGGSDVVGMATRMAQGIGAAFAGGGGSSVGYNAAGDLDRFELNGRATETGQARIDRWTSDNMRDYGMDAENARFAALARLKRDYERTGEDWRRSGFDLANIRALDTERPDASKRYGPGSGPQGAVWKNTGADRWELTAGGGAGAGYGATNIYIQAPVYGVEHFENMVASATEQLYRRGRS